MLNVTKTSKYIASYLHTSNGVWPFEFFLSTRSAHPILAMEMIVSKDSFDP